MLNLEKLDQYIVIRTGSVDPDVAEGLRELESDFGPGVYALWSDEEQSIVAFVFEPARYSQEEAEEWVREAEERSAESAGSPGFIRELAAGIVSGLASMGLVRAPQAAQAAQGGEAARAFDEIFSLVESAIYEQYPTAWVVTMGESAAIFEWRQSRWSITYEIDDEDDVTLGQAEEVSREWVKPDGTPVMLHSFSVTLGDGDEAEPAEDDGLIWKEIIHPGSWFKIDTGRVIDIGADIIRAAFESWKKGFPKFISVPADHHHSQTAGFVPADSNRGFVAELKLIGDRLFGGFDIRHPETREGIENGTIADCSVFLQPDVVHPETGEYLPWVLTHVLLTNNPLVQDLDEWGRLPVGAKAGDDDRVLLNRYDHNRTEEDHMPGEGEEVALSAQARELLDVAESLGLSAEGLSELVAERSAIRERARDLEITQVVRALEGVGEHGGVEQIEGRRHYPVVCAAVEEALREQPRAMGLSANGDGVTPVDAVVLQIVNALPAEARMAMSAADPSAPTGDKEPEVEDESLSADDGDGRPSDEDVDKFAESLGV